MGNCTCDIDGCESAVRYPSRGWCNTHYQRWKKYGDPGAEVAAYYRTPAERFAALTEVRGDCLVWTGTTDPNGYARISVSGRRVFAHRYAWEQANGPIPDGVEIDHPRNRPEDKETLRRLARRYDLIVTGGTDFHGMHMSRPVPLGAMATTDDNIRRLEALAKERRRGAQD